MPPRLFEVTVVGRRLWIEVDGRVQCVSFRVARVVDATSEDDAVRAALAVVGSDPRAQAIAGKPAPSLSVERVAAVESRPPVNPGFRFLPE